MPDSPARAWLDSKCKLEIAWKLSILDHLNISSLEDQYARLEIGDLSLVIHSA